MTGPDAETPSVEASAGSPDESDEAEKAKRAAFRLLARRAYTRAEILKRLAGRRFSRQAVEQTMLVLDRLNLVDDTDFARRWVEERMRLRPAGRPVFARELRRRGVVQTVVDEVLDEAFLGQDLTAVATELLRKSRTRYAGLDAKKALSRMYAFLWRRGFDGSVSREACERAWAEFGDGSQGAVSWEP